MPNFSDELGVQTIIAANAFREGVFGVLPKISHFPRIGQASFILNGMLLAQSYKAASKSPMGEAGAALVFGGQQLAGTKGSEASPQREQRGQRHFLTGTKGSETFLDAAPAIG